MMHKCLRVGLVIGLGGVARVGFGQVPSTWAPAAGTAHCICWREGRLLEWEDFRATTFPRSAPMAAASVGAVSATRSTLTPITENGVPSYRVGCVFLRDSSWVNRGVIRTAAGRAATLAHEQLHFDIGELIARKLRRRIAQGLQAGEELYGPLASRDISGLQTQEDLLNNQFDQEVVRVGGHRFEAPVRKRWQQRIARELSALAAYKSTATTCP